MTTTHGSAVRADLRPCRKGFSVVSETMIETPDHLFRTAAPIQYGLARHPADQCDGTYASRRNRAEPASDLVEDWRLGKYRNRPGSPTSLPQVCPSTDPS